MWSTSVPSLSPSPLPLLLPGVLRQDKYPSTTGPWGQPRQKQGSNPSLLLLSEGTTLGCPLP